MRSNQDNKFKQGCYCLFFDYFFNLKFACVHLGYKLWHHRCIRSFHSSKSLLQRYLYKFHGYITSLLNSSSPSYFCSYSLVFLVISTFCLTLSTIPPQSVPLKHNLLINAITTYLFFLATFQALHCHYFNFKNISFNFINSGFDKTCL